MNFFTIWLLGTESGQQTLMQSQCPSVDDVYRYLSQFNPSNDDFEFIQLVSCSLWREDGSPSDMDWYYQYAVENYNKLLSKLQDTSNETEKNRIKINFFESLLSVYKDQNPLTYSNGLDATSTMRAYYRLPPDYKDGLIKRQFTNEIKSDQKRFIRSAKKARTSIVQLSKRNVISVSIATILVAITIGVLRRDK